MTMLRAFLLLFVVAGLVGRALPAAAQTPAAPPVAIAPASEAWRAALPRDANAATEAYLARLSPEVVARANAYVEGGYWLQLWNFLLGLAVAWAMLGRQRAARVREAASRIARGRPGLRDAAFGAAYAVAGWVLTLPLTVYQQFWREHAYGMATQGFGAWFAEQLVSLAVGAVALAVGVAVVYAVIRRAGAAWWLWGTVATMSLLVLAMLIAPVWIDPLFNTYKPVADGDVRRAVVQLAQANGVPTDHIVEFDASRQTTRVSAHVTGLFGSASLRLNDNLLRRTSLPELRGVVAHELGHYVLNHIYKMLACLALLNLAAFLFARWAMQRLLAWRGALWGLKGTDDVAALPLLAAVFSVFLFAATPLTNTLIRVQEVEADRFALNLSREPHGLAEALLKLTEYRKPDPGPIEEFVFFDHPSTRFRVHDAMRWREAMGTAP